MCFGDSMRPTQRLVAVCTILDCWCEISVKQVLNLDYFIVSMDIQNLRKSEVFPSFHLQTGRILSLTTTRFIIIAIALGVNREKHKKNHF